MDAAKLELELNEARKYLETCRVEFLRTEGRVQILVKLIEDTNKEGGVKKEEKSIESKPKQEGDVK